MTRRGPKFSPSEKEARLTEIARSVARGDSATDVAARWGVTVQMARAYVRQVNARWRDAQVAAVEEGIAREVARLDELERTAWKAWATSLEPRVIDQTELPTTPDGPARPIRHLRRVEQRDGNPAYLATILSCIERRCKLLGLDAPQEVSISLARQVATDIAREHGLDPEAVLTEARRLLAEARGRGRV